MFDQVGPAIRSDNEFNYIIHQNALSNQAKVQKLNDGNRILIMTISKLMILKSG
jgi:hypothetical protein